MSHAPRVLSTTLIAALLITSLALGAQRETVDGVLHVRNGAEPRDGVEHLRLEELWRVGDADDDVLFGLITRVLADANGDLYVLDGQLSQVHVYDRDGEHLRTLFGEGEGPGEVRGPRDLVLLDDGRVGVVQEQPGKMVFVDRMNNPAGELTFGGPGVAHGGFCQAFGAAGGGGVLAVAGFVQSPGAEAGHMTQTNFLGRFDADGSETASYCRDANDVDFTNFTFHETVNMASYWWNAAVTAGGEVIVAPRLDRYEIHIMSADGALERVIECEHEPWLRTADEKQRFVEVVKAIYGGAPFQIKVAPSEHEPVIAAMPRGLRVHADGTIWVLTSRGTREQEPGVMATFDVFSPGGEFVRQAAVHFDADATRDGVFLLDDGRAVVIKGFVDAAMAQFTGGRLSIDLEGEDEASMEVIVCRVVR